MQIVICSYYYPNMVDCTCRDKLYWPYYYQHYATKCQRVLWKAMAMSTSAAVTIATIIAFIRSALSEPTHIRQESIDAVQSQSIGCIFSRPVTSASAIPSKGPLWHKCSTANQFADRGCCCYQQISQRSTSMRSVSCFIR